MLNRAFAINLTCAVIALAAAGCTGTAATETPTPSVAAPPPVRTTYDIPADLTALILPTTGVESRGSQGLDLFAQTIGYTATRTCARSARVPMPEIAPPMLTRFLDLPDLQLLRAHGLSTDTPADTTASTAPKGSAAAAAQDRCVTEGGAAAQRFRALYASLQGQWWRDITALRDRPPVAQAFHSFSRCLRDHQLKAHTESDFFALADASPHDLALARIYATCMVPVESARDPLRKELRTSFVARHGSEINTIRNSLVPGIRQSERTHGIRIAFPTS
ncbi:hypothetical protein [Streptomyces sp. H39-S7]|uniref:hypothetical protein n=1 Tax=Streptomyces sp. H39-S7 TaxID=3004357 RepID=UPI0022AF7F01|nr:hypothetical protein [Streptomyces sp. H39-S7]MCZ4121669.1 hypothetical protein [Streptomyces sp. H39-S7]